jgi:hypothetical protein
MNAKTLLELRRFQYRYYEDIAFEIADWMRANISPGTSIVADHHMYVYIPSGYKNVKIFKRYEKDAPDKLRDIVNTHDPKILYLNQTPVESMPLPPLENIMPGKKLKLIKCFKNKPYHYQKWPGSNFMIYEVD